MSRAFVNEDHAEPAPPPERAISEHRNLVTRRGLDLIEENLTQLNKELAAKPDAAAKILIERDLRYWAERQASAELIAPQAASAAVGFGSRVTLSRNGGNPEILEIVGEDEADPAAGKISYVSPFALALKGAEAGDEIEFTARESTLIKVIAVDNAS